MFDFAFNAQRFAVYLIPTLLGIIMHEVAHGWMASRKGDQTARFMGRLTLNPVSHFDALAGPVTNFLLAIGFALVLGAVVAMLPSPDISDTTRYFLLMLVAGVNINLCLAWINLLPIPPLDGSKIVAYFLPPRAAWAYMSAGRYGFIILVLLLATGLLGHILGPLIGGGSDLLLSLVGIK